MRLLFVIQGHGRGHLTQALSLKRMADRSGHEVVAALIGGSEYFSVPDFFRSDFDGPIHVFDTLEMVPHASALAVDWWSTVSANVKRGRSVAQGVDTIGKAIRRYAPDVVVNFFEPVASIGASLSDWSVPTVGIAHQFMFLHHDYPYPPDFRSRKLLLKSFTRVVASGADRLLALSTTEEEPAMDGRLSVVPPLLRDDLTRMADSTTTDPFFLIYINRLQQYEDLIAWSRRHGRTRLEVFWSHPDFPTEWSPSEWITFHPLHGRRFIEMMSRCAAVATTAGFESMSEAMYLGKPLMMVPLRSQFEQACNVADAERLGAAVAASEFDIDILVEFAGRYDRDPSRFKQWVDTAEIRFMEELEDVALRRRVSARHSAATP